VQAKHTSTGLCLVDGPFAAQSLQLVGKHIHCELLRLSGTLPVDLSTVDTLRDLHCASALGPLVAGILPNCTMLQFRMRRCLDSPHPGSGLRQVEKGQRFLVHPVLCCAAKQYTAPQ
jgi:hypothetical protein